MDGDRASTDKLASDLNENDENESDDESSEEDEDGSKDEEGSVHSEETGDKSLTPGYSAFLEFLKLGCSGTPLQGYQTVVVIISTIPPSVRLSLLFPKHLFISFPPADNLCRSLERWSNLGRAFTIPFGQPSIHAL